MKPPTNIPRAVSVFRMLHESGCFVIPNPWDRGTAVFLHHLGYPALATTSAGFAFSMGLPDSMTALSVDTVLTHTRDIVESTPLPVNADFQAGYADDLETLAANVDRCVKTGVAGLSIEDSTGDESEPLFERSVAVERIRATRQAIDETGIPVVLTARCEAWLVGYPDAKNVVLDRLAAFAEAGADCLYAPGASDPETIAAIVKVADPRPVNVLMAAPNPALSVPVLADLGVRRISVGSALARASWGAMTRAARGILETQTFDALDGSAPFDELNNIFDGRSQD